MVATLICLITSQVISSAKARAEASGLSGDGGIIERPERLFIVMLGTWLSDIPFFPLPWVLHVTMWGLAVASVVTLLQRMHTVRTSPGAMDRLVPAADPSVPSVPEASVEDEADDIEAGQSAAVEADSADEASSVEASRVEKPGTSQP